MLKQSQTEGVRSRRRVVGTGEMADRIRTFQWELTDIGPIVEWSETLFSAVSIMLSTRHPVLLLWGPEMVLLYNDTFRPILTDRHPQALGMGGRQFWTDVWPIVGGQLESVLFKGQSVFNEKALVPILRHGVLEEAYFNYSYSPVYDPDGRIAGIITICEDVTSTVTAERERAIAEQTLRLRQEELDKSLHALRKERTQLLSVVHQAPAFFALLEGPQHVISMVNPLYMKLVGNRDVLGKPIAEALPEAVEQGYVKLLDHVLSSGEPVTGQNARFDLTWAEGQPADERFLDFVYQPLREPDNTVSGVIVLGVDITERRRAEKVLIQTENLAVVGRLAASIAHEINNPLASVMNLLYLARATQSLTEKDDYLDIAERELRRVAAITTQTLRFHKQATKPKLISCEELLDDVLSICQSRLMNTGVRIERRDRCHRPLSCFEGEIRQVLNNLVSNAVDAMKGTGGRLLLRSRTVTNRAFAPQGVAITVADTGTGIGPDVLKKIFEPFFTTKGLGGTGLGLWVTRDIVARHQGSLRVRSHHQPGRSGTVFVLFLPFAPDSCRPLA